MTYALFAKVLAILLLVVCKQGYSEEKVEANKQDDQAAREKRGINMLRLGRGLQMLRLGKRGGLNMLRLGRSSPSSEEVTDYLYSLLENDPEFQSYRGEDDYMIPENGRYRRSSDRAVALPRIGKQTEGDEYEDMDEFEKRALGMLRLGRSGSDFGEEDGFTEEDEKRALGMLRLGKRRMSMLRLGKRPMAMLRLGKRPMAMLRLGKRPMQMLRLGKRPMQMLRLGKREDDDAQEKRAMSMLRLGKRSEETVNPESKVAMQH